MKQDLYNLQVRSYAAAKGGRLTSDWMTSSASQDAELAQDLPVLRARSRQMIRDNPHAFNLRRIIQNNVVGSGIGIQCQVTKADGTPDQRLNDKIEEAWNLWCEKETCQTAGRMSMTDILRMAIGNVFADGEFFVRKVHSAFGNGKIPFALEIIEPDLLLGHYASLYRTTSGNAVRMGVEVDGWLRPVAYWMLDHHPGDDLSLATVGSSQLLRIPADEIEHLYLVERWPQTRGIPWMHAVLRRLRDISSYTESELVAARAAANIFGFVKSEQIDYDPDTIKKERESAGDLVRSSPGEVRRLLPGESFEGFSPSRPNANIEAFMRYMLREIAAGIGTSYETLSRDYSQSNYSSSRLALLDDRDLWRVLQGWLIENFLTKIYREWLDSAVLSGAISIPNYFKQKPHYQAVRFRPRGWSWIDPAKEVQAYINAVDKGFMSYTDVVAATGNGQDFEDVMRQAQKDRETVERFGFKPVSNKETVLFKESKDDGVSETKKE